MNTPTTARRAAGHIGLYAVGTVVRQIVGFLMLPVYTRFLTPADYGVVAMLTLLLSIFELMIGARFAQAIPKFYFEEDEARQRGTVIGTALTVTVSVSTLGASLLLLGAEPLAEAFLADSTLWHYVAFFGATLVTSAIENYGLTYLRLRDKPVLFVGMSLAKLFVALTLNIVLVVVLGWGVAGVVASTVLSSVVFAVLLGGYMLYQVGGLRVNWTLARRLVRFSWPLWVAGGAAVYSNFANRFLLRYFGDLSEVGLYDLAARFGSLIVILVWQPFNQWWQTERFQLLRRDDQGQPIFRAVFTVVTAMLALFGAGISLFADTVIRIMADPAFHGAAQAVPPLTFAVVLQQVALFHNFSFLASERTGFIAYLKYGSAILLTVCYITAIPAFGYLGAAYATLGAATVMLFMTVTLATRVFDTTARLWPALAHVVLAVLIVAVDQRFVSGYSLLVSFTLKCALALGLLLAMWWLLERDPSTRVQLAALRQAVARKLGR